MFEYPVDIETDDDGSPLVTFPDLPEAVTFGEDYLAVIVHCFVARFAHERLCRA